MVNSKFNKALFGARLTELMKENGDTIYSLSEVVGMTPSAISRYRSGGHAPRADVVERMAQRYHVSPRWLIGAVDERTENQDLSRYAKLIPVLGQVAAGEPLLPVEKATQYEPVNQSEQLDFALVLRGDSMTGARMYDGDMLFVRRQEDVEDGELAVVEIEEEVTVKRVYRYGDTIVLRPENPMLKEMIFRAPYEGVIRILGKVIYVKGYVR